MVVEEREGEFGSPWPPARAPHAGYIRHADPSGPRVSLPLPPLYLQICNYTAAAAENPHATFWEDRYLCCRAQIFRRDAVNVTSLSDMQRLMRSVSHSCGTHPSRPSGG